MISLFDEYGNLNIDDMIAEQPSFQKIMADGIVTDEELKEQSDKVASLLATIETSMNEGQLVLIRELLAELSVLVAIREIYDK